MIFKPLKIFSSCLITLFIFLQFSSTFHIFSERNNTIGNIILTNNTNNFTNTNEDFSHLLFSEQIEENSETEEDPGSEIFHGDYLPATVYFGFKFHHPSVFFYSFFLFSDSFPLHLLNGILRI